MIAEKEVEDSEVETVETEEATKIASTVVSLVTSLETVELAEDQEADQMSKYIFKLRNQCQKKLSFNI